MQRQRAMLDAAIERILNFRHNQQEFTTLTVVARSHRNMSLSAAHFEAFGQAFLNTLSGVLQVSRVSIDAWKAVIWLAMEYLIRETRDERSRPGNFTAASQSRIKT